MRTTVAISPKMDSDHGENPSELDPSHSSIQRFSVNGSIIEFVFPSGSPGGDTATLKVPLTAQEMRACLKVSSRAGLSIEAWITREIRTWLDHLGP